MNTRDIQQFDIWSPQGLQPVNKLKFLTFYGYEFNDGPGYVDYQLLGPNNEMQYQATLLIPESIVQQWGADDDVVWDYAANTLGLIILQ